MSYKQFAANRRRHYRNARRMYNRSAAAVGSVSRLARQIYNLKQLVNTEFKYFDLSAQATPDTTGSVTVLNAMAEGTSESERVGNSIRMKNFLARLRFKINGSASNTNVRVIFFFDKQTNGALPAVTAVLESASVDSPLNINANGKRFVILSDVQVSLNSAATSNAHRKVYRKLDYKPQFKGSAAGIANVAEGALCMLLLSTEPTNTPTVNYYTRVRYIDN